MSEGADIIQGPWKKLPKGKAAKTPTKAERELYRLRTLAEEITENTCVQMIHTLSEHEFDVNGEEFLRDVGFIIEAVKGLVYRELGLEHAMSDFITNFTKPLVDLPKNPESNVDHDKLSLVSKYISELPDDKPEE